MSNAYWMILSHQSVRVLNPISRVFGLGFEATTGSLQNSGWRLSVEERVMERNIGLLMQFEENRLYMQAECVDFDYYRYLNHPRNETAPKFHIKRIMSDLVVRSYMPTMVTYQAFDATPIVRYEQEEHLSQLNIFQPSLKRTQEIIVDQAEVTDILDQLLKRQSAEQVEILKRNRQRAAREQMQQSMHGTPEPLIQMHAQILSFKKAA